MKQTAKVSDEKPHDDSDTAAATATAADEHDTPSNNDDAAQNNNDAADKTNSAEDDHAAEDRPISPSGRVYDPIVSKESWSTLFSKPKVPRCESHNEPCTRMQTKKSGFNCGREFYMCARPLGPSGSKERNTQWRCPTFIWTSDWNSSNGSET